MVSQDTNSAVELLVRFSEVWWELLVRMRWSIVIRSIRMRRSGSRSKDSMVLSNSMVVVSMAWRLRVIIIMDIIIGSIREVEVGDLMAIRTR